MATNKYRTASAAEMEVRKQIAAGIRPAVRAITRSARAFEGSKLRKKSGKTSKTISGRVRPHRTTGAGGVIIAISGRGMLNIWEHGRKAYTVRPRSQGTPGAYAPGGGIRKALKLYSLGGILRRRVNIPAAGPRPVLRPAIDRNLGKLAEASGAATAHAAGKLIARKIRSQPASGGFLPFRIPEAPGWALVDQARLRGGR